MAFMRRGRGVNNGWLSDGVRNLYYFLDVVSFKALSSEDTQGNIYGWNNRACGLCFNDSIGRPGAWVEVRVGRVDQRWMGDIRPIYSAPCVCAQDAS